MVGMSIPASSIRIPVVCRSVWGAIFFLAWPGRRPSGSPGRKLIKNQRENGMERDDRLMLDFTRAWIPYGGPSAADIFIEFGMTPGRFFDRLDAVLATVQWSRFPVGERDYFESIRKRSPTWLNSARNPFGPEAVDQLNPTGG